MVVVSVNAADNVGVTRVDLRVNGATVASTNVAPYQFAWNSTTVPNAPVALTAVAYDAAGHSTASLAVTVTVSNATVNNTTLSVNFINPSNGAFLTGPTTITTVASDTLTSASIAQKLYIDGALKASAKNRSLSYQWNANRIASGVHTILVTATDNAGNSATKQVQITTGK
jgi:thermitase